MDTYAVERYTFDRVAGLGRHVRHDSRSRAFAFRADLPTKSIRWESHLPEVLDQGDLGACTGYSSLQCLSMSPFWDTLIGSPLHWGPDDAKSIYAQATKVDEITGAWPPDDTGSDGLAAAKACVALRLINGYRHAFSFSDALAALQIAPAITGTTWYNCMFEPDGHGLVTLDRSSGIAGGHEYVLDEVDVRNQRVGFLSSWGSGWGLHGRFYLTWSDYAALLADSGDVTIFNPINQHAPEPSPAGDQPTPTPDPPIIDSSLAAFATDVQAWRRSKTPAWGSKRAQRAVNRYLKRKGY